MGVLRRAQYDTWRAGDRRHTGRRLGVGCGRAGAAGTRSDLYNEPVSFEGRSLEGTSRFDDSKELAQSLEGVEIPIEDLPPVEPGPAGSRRKSILKHAGDMPDPGLSYIDENEAITDRRASRDLLRETAVRLRLRPRVYLPVRLAPILVFCLQWV